MDSVKGSNAREVNVEKILKAIKDGYWKEPIEAIRNHLKKGEKKIAGELKSELPAFTISATFKGNRKIENVDIYTGLIHLDYDKLDNVEEIKAKAIIIPNTYSAFISPSGKGLKILVKTDAELSTHKAVFNALKKYYDDMLGVVSDKSVKDVTRLCFVSYDPKLFINDNSETFLKDSQNKENTLDDIWKLTSNNDRFEEGNRNNFIHKFSCNANRMGYYKSETLSYALNYCEATFDNTEIEKTVTSAFSNTNEWGTVSISSKPSKPSISSINSEKKHNPLIPNSIYENLPLILKESCANFEDRERDVYLTSALSVISGGLHNIHGLYSNEVVYPNLFSFVIAPPASGKGSMKYAKQLGDCYHEELLSSSREAKMEYKKQKKFYDLKLKKAKTDQDIENLKEPFLPKSNLFFLPANTSSSMLIKHLEDNEGIGCICETESDTLTTALKQDWGGYSDILRKGFHSENISKSRVKELEYSEVKEPKFSMTVTGTPNQKDLLITSAEDGLFSRFLFYSYVTNPQWKNTYTSEMSISKKDVFNKYSIELCDKFSSVSKQVFKMTEIQGNELDKRFTANLDRIIQKHDNVNVPGVLFRLGLMTFKIAMVLTALRTDKPEIICNDTDFETAITLVEKVYVTHSLSLMNSLNTGNKYPKNLIDEKLLNWASSKKTFKRSEIAKFAKELNVQDRTLTNKLSKFIKEEKLTQPLHGTYSIV